VVQERAWTSPIWYRPEGIARLRARVRFGRAPATGELQLSIALGRAPLGLDPARDDLTLRVADAADIYAVTIPAGTLRRKGPGVFTLAGRGNRPPGLRRASLALRGKRGARLVLRAGPLDLSHVDRAEHIVTVTLAMGTYRTAHARRWVTKGDDLVPGGR
jgi:hypothetical protein